MIIYKLYEADLSSKPDMINDQVLIHPHSNIFCSKILLHMNFKDEINRQQKASVSFSFAPTATAHCRPIRTQRSGLCRSCAS